MLIIRTQQMEAFRPSLRQRFEDELTAIVAATYPGATRQAGGVAQIGQLVRLGVAQAAAAGCHSKRQASLTVSLMLMLGVDFASDPQLPWVAAYLDPDGVADPTMRLEALFAAALDYLGATAGDDGEYLAGAAARMGRLRLAEVSRRSGEGWISDVARMLEALYPEKFRHQGEAAMRRLIWIGTRRARLHGLTGAADSFVFITLMFMLGSGFDRDPLYGWAGAILGESGDAATRGERLYAQATSRIALSLNDQ